MTVMPDCSLRAPCCRGTLRSSNRPRLWAPSVSEPIYITPCSHTASADRRVAVSSFEPPISYQLRCSTSLSGWLSSAPDLHERSCGGPGFTISCTE